MKKTLIIVGGIIIIALIVWIMGRGASEVADGAIEGVVVSVNTEGAMVDGPYIVVIRTDAGVEETINVPSMGINLCLAKNSIKNPTEISSGMRVAVSGMRVEGGAIVPCESANHFLRAI